MRFFQKKPKPDPNSATALLTRYAAAPEKDKSAVREELLATPLETVDELLSRLTDVRQKRKDLRKGMFQLGLISIAVMLPVWWLLTTCFRSSTGLSMRLCKR